MPTLTDDPSSTRRPPRPGRLRRLLAGLTLLQLALVLVQATSAGHVLSGNDAFLIVHEVVGANVIGFVSIAQIVVVALLRRAGHVESWLVVVAVVTFGLVVAEVYLGFDGRLALHVPNAIAIVAGQVLMLAPVVHVATADAAG